MKAAVVVDSSPPTYTDFEEPTAANGGFVATVRAAALTNLDIATAERRHYFALKERTFVVGKEAVAQIGNGPRHFYSVYGLVAPFGSMAERTLVRPEFGLPITDDVPDTLAAAIANAGLAGWLPLSWRAKLRAGETVLVLGATGTSGMIATAAAKLLGAGRVIAAGRNHRALQKAIAAGADAIVDLTANENLSQSIRDAAGTEIDVVIDYLNGPAAEAALETMNYGGRMVQIGSMAAPGMHLNAQIPRKLSLDILGFGYYHAPLAEQAAAYQQLCKFAMNGKIAIDYVSMPLSEFGNAWNTQKAGGSARIVLVP